ncbi:S1 RNA-binding domain-containing protein [Candidatus Bathyarchaeota archaeon]|jgi:exosome complex component RRP4|nr:S1 RNA-binding domain-containing protein [Candidatus Bathyarchaeota archaeon]
MSEKFESRDVVVPGDLLYEGRVRTGENVYRKEGNVHSSHVGLVNYGKDRVSVIALEGGFTPLVGDMVIGTVVDIELGRWLVDIGAATEAILSTNDAINKPFRTHQDLTKILDVGDTIIAKIVDLDRYRTPILSIQGRELGKVFDGFVIKITPSKIPRLIGKKGSMINMILRETRTSITIGQNGRILISGRRREDEELVVEVIRKIEAEAHTSGLTNRIQEYLKKRKEEIRNE